MEWNPSRASIASRLKVPPGENPAAPRPIETKFDGTATPDDVAALPPMPPTWLARIATAAATAPPRPNRRALRRDGSDWWR